jgi:hypothetical protein
MNPVLYTERRELHGGDFVEPKPMSEMDFVTNHTPITKELEQLKQRLEIEEGVWDVGYAASTIIKDGKYRICNGICYCSGRVIIDNDDNIDGQFIPLPIIYLPVTPKVGQSIPITALSSNLMAWNDVSRGVVTWFSSPAPNDIVRYVTLDIPALYPEEFSDITSTVILLTGEIVLNKSPNTLIPGIDNGSPGFNGSSGYYAQVKTDAYFEFQYFIA